MISTHLAIKFRANAPLMTETVPSGLAVPNLSAHSDGHDTRMAPDGCHLRVDQRVQNAGIVSEPGHRSRRYSVALNRTADLCLSPDDGLAQRCKGGVLVGAMAGLAFGAVAGWTRTSAKNGRV